MKVYIRTSKGDTDLLPDTVDYAKRISNMDYLLNAPFKLTGPGEMATKDGMTYTPWEISNELYPSELVFDLYKFTNDQKDSRISPSYYKSLILEIPQDFHLQSTVDTIRTLRSIDAWIHPVSQ